MYSLDTLDFYLNSSEKFGKCLKSIDSSKILGSLESEEDSGFNEKMLQLICLTQAIGKF